MQLHCQCCNSTVFSYFSLDKEKRFKVTIRTVSSFYRCEGGTRTRDLLVMSQTSYQLLYLAIYMLIKFGLSEITTSPSDPFILTFLISATQLGLEFIHTTFRSYKSPMLPCYRVGSSLHDHYNNSAFSLPLTLRAFSYAFNAYLEVNLLH